MRTKDLSQDERAMLLSALSSTGGAFTESRFTSIGPSIGAELKQKAWIALLLVISGITLFVAFAFRKVSEPISSWKYGLVTIIALMHDVVVPVGAVAFLGSFMLDYQADALLSPHSSPSWAFPCTTQLLCLTACAKIFVRIKKSISRIHLRKQWVQVSDKHSLVLSTLRSRLCSYSQHSFFLEGRPQNHLRSYSSSA